MEPVVRAPGAGKDLETSDERALMNESNTGDIGVRLSYRPATIVAAGKAAGVGLRYLSAALQHWRNELADVS